MKVSETNPFIFPIAINSMIVAIAAITLTCGEKDPPPEKEEPHQFEQSIRMNNGDRPMVRCAGIGTEGDDIGYDVYLQFGCDEVD